MLISNKHLLVDRCLQNRRGPGLVAPVSIKLTVHDPLCYMLYKDHERILDGHCIIRSQKLMANKIKCGGVYLVQSMPIQCLYCFLLPFTLWIMPTTLQFADRTTKWYVQSLIIMAIIRNGWRSKNACHIWYDMVCVDGPANLIAFHLLIETVCMAFSGVAPCYA